MTRYRKFLALSLCLLAFTIASSAADKQRWVGTWATAPYAETPKASDAPFSDVTLRQIVHTSIPGNAVRIKLSNDFGIAQLHVDAVHVALRSNAAEIVTGSDHPVTFNGKSSITIPAGTSVLSDAVAITVAPFADLAISFYLPVQTIATVTFHNDAKQTSYIANGNVADVVALNAAKPIHSWYFLTGVEVQPLSEKAAAVVAIGDSITDGALSTNDTNARWPDVLARRLQAEKKTSDIAVLNEGIGGNRVLNDNTGPNLLARFDRDVLAQGGVKYVIVLEGINDIGRLSRGAGIDPADKITADDLIQGFTQVIDRAHGHGIRIYGATILPYMGAGYSSPAGEAVREAVNQWIRTGGAFDGVVDLDKATQDPANPSAISPQYDSGDHLHPGDAGYKAMGEAVDLKLFQ
jgi:lysophospholipase L1-like esterase